MRRSSSRSLSGSACSCPHRSHGALLRVLEKFPDRPPWRAVLGFLVPLTALAIRFPPTLEYSTALRAGFLPPREGAGFRPGILLCLPAIPIPCSFSFPERTVHERDNASAETYYSHSRYAFVASILSSASVHRVPADLVRRELLSVPLQRRKLRDRPRTAVYSVSTSTLYFLSFLYNVFRSMPRALAATPLCP